MKEAHQNEYYPHYPILDISNIIHQSLLLKQKQVALKRSLPHTTSLNTIGVFDSYAGIGYASAKEAVCVRLNSIYNAASESQLSADLKFIMDHSDSTHNEHSHYLIKEGLIDLILNIYDRCPSPCKILIVKTLSNLCSHDSEACIKLISKNNLIGKIYSELHYITISEFHVAALSLFSSISQDSIFGRDYILSMGITELIEKLYSKYARDMCIITEITSLICSLLHGKPKPMLTSIICLQSFAFKSIFINDNQIMCNALKSLVYITDCNPECLNELVIDGMLPKLGECIVNKPSPIDNLAILVIGNLCTFSSRYINNIIKYGILKFMISKLCVIEDEQMKIDLSWAISNITCDFKNSYEIYSLGTYGALLKELSAGYHDSKMNSAIGISNGILCIDEHYLDKICTEDILMELLGFLCSGIDAKVVYLILSSLQKLMTINSPTIKQVLNKINIRSYLNKLQKFPDVEILNITSQMLGMTNSNNPINN